MLKDPEHSSSLREVREAALIVQVGSMEDVAYCLTFHGLFCVLSHTAKVQWLRGGTTHSHVINQEKTI